MISAAFCEGRGRFGCDRRSPIALLSVRVSAVTVERPFSSARLVLSDRGKERLTGKTPEDLMMLGGNRKLAEQLRFLNRRLARTLRTDSWAMGGGGVVPQDSAARNGRIQNQDLWWQ
jgi:hypothetical protein